MFQQELKRNVAATTRTGRSCGAGRGGRAGVLDGDGQPGEAGQGPVSPAYITGRCQEVTTVE